MTHDGQLTGIVLCGGQSRRMGRSKCDLLFGKETMLARVVRLVGQVTDSVVVVAAAGQHLDLPPEVRVAHDRYEHRGPLEGIATGLELAAATGELAFVTGCDVPLLVPDVVRLLVDSLSDHDAVAMEADEHQYPLGAVYRCALAAAARRLLEEHTNASARALLQSSNTRWLAPADIQAVDPQHRSLHNVNSPEDYVAAARLAGVDCRL